MSAERFDTQEVNRRFERLENEVQSKYSHIHDRLKSVESGINDIRDILMSLAAQKERMHHFDNRMSRAEADINAAWKYLREQVASQEAANSGTANRITMIQNDVRRINDHRKTCYIHEVEAREKERSGMNYNAMLQLFVLLAILIIQVYVVVK